MTWKGVIIEESLEDKEILKLFRIVGTRESYLESEEYKGTLKFHNIEVDDVRKEQFVNKAASSIKQGWYIHIVKGDMMIVIFKGKFFEFSEHDVVKIEEAKQYGLQIGIVSEQMDFESLIKNPFG